jgi:hypothetical protein
VIKGCHSAANASPITSAVNTVPTPLLQRRSGPIHLQKHGSHRILVILAAISRYLVIKGCHCARNVPPLVWIANTQPLAGRCSLSQQCDQIPLHHHNLTLRSLHKATLIALFQQIPTPGNIPYCHRPLSSWEIKTGIEVRLRPLLLLQSHMVLRSRPTYRIQTRERTLLIHQCGTTEKWRTTPLNTIRAMIVHN